LAAVIGELGCKRICLAEGFKIVGGMRQQTRFRLLKVEIYYMRVTFELRRCNNIYDDDTINKQHTCHMHSAISKGGERRMFGMVNLFSSAKV
jgi:hypothetical protein